MSELDLQLVGTPVKAHLFKIGEVKPCPMKVPESWCFDSYDVISLHKEFGELSYVTEPADKGPWIEEPPFDRWTAILEE